ncbi:hypothetical protein K7640_00740 [Micromonospora sp. PLK6-60]|uniref:hypothetical protein n=1 Tax=Micromonospora sp. PLK6-60 TaxID=2873383 RepID=UPI001CA73581|nr:hypothetical protein [Micromonospora sp. PLK6-60]MBY8870368.1 hypothetical protein [Micromonospora sp. PLK6-60]
MTEATGPEPPADGRPRPPGTDQPAPGTRAALARKLSRRWRATRSRVLTAWQELVTDVPASPPPPPPAPVTTEHRDGSGQIVVPAQGYVFHFTVRVTLTWSAPDIRPDLLGWHVQQFRAETMLRLTRLATREARKLAPHRAGDLEVALQRAIGDQTPWRYRRGDTVITCRPDVWVRLDERVRAALEPYWEQVVRLDAQYDVQLRRAQLAERLNRRWVEILEEMVDGPTCDDVDRETREHLRDAVRQMTEDGQAAAEWGRELLAQRQRDREVFWPLLQFDGPGFGAGQAGSNEETGTAGESDAEPADPAA